LDFGLDLTFGLCHLSFVILIHPCLQTGALFVIQLTNFVIFNGLTFLKFFLLTKQKYISNISPLSVIIAFLLKTSHFKTIFGTNLALIIFRLDK